MSVLLTFAWVSAALALVACSLTLFNLIAWPRGRESRDPLGKTSILVPARNEAGNIETCVRAAVALNPHEVVVIDDGSTDATPDILARLATEFSLLRVLRGQGLPTGWVGKPHACHQLARSATGEWLLFVDADVVLHAGALHRLNDLATRRGASVVTAVPRQRTESLAERVVLPLLHLTYTSWLPLPLIWMTHDPRLLAANGQVLAVTREAYDAIGGFAAVRREVVDDMAFCRLAKGEKNTVVFADGYELATCRMYGDARGVWDGFSKNLFEGLGNSLLALMVVDAVYLLAFVAPFVWLLASVGSPELVWPALVGVASNALLRASLVVRFRQSVLGALLHPLGILALVAISLNSARCSLGGQVTWAGRTYAKRSDRAAAEPLDSTYDAVPVVSSAQGEAYAQR
ncbi:MAG: chlorobactene glucosyltransferase [Bradymonadia bacterium]|jgi:chlorobactene glucosyltransferase